MKTIICKFKSDGKDVKKTAILRLQIYWNQAILGMIFGASSLR